MKPPYLCFRSLRRPRPSLHMSHVHNIRTGIVTCPKAPLHRRVVQHSPYELRLFSFENVSMCRGRVCRRRRRPAPLNESCVEIPYSSDVHVCVLVGAFYTCTCLCFCRTGKSAMHDASRACPVSAHPASAVTSRMPAFHMRPHPFSLPTMPRPRPPDNGNVHLLDSICLSSHIHMYLHVAALYHGVPPQPRLFSACPLVSHPFFVGVPRVPPSCTLRLRHSPPPER